MSKNFDSMLAQARDLQRAVADAVGKAADQMKPILAEQVKTAQELQASLARHATETAEISHEQSREAAQHVQEFITIGAAALRDSVEQTRDVATKMAEESRRIVDSLTPRR